MIQPNPEINFKTILPPPRTWIPEAAPISLEDFFEKDYEDYIGLILVGQDSTKIFSSNIVQGEQGKGYAIVAKLNQNSATKNSNPITYELEVDNLRVRNKFSANELIFQQKRAVNGSLIVSSTGKIKKIKRTLIQNSQI